MYVIKNGKVSVSVSAILALYLFGIGSIPKCAAHTRICEQCYLCTALPWKQLQKRHLVAKNEFAFSFRPTRKDQQVGGEYANDSCWCQTGIGFKNDLFQWFRVDSFFWENNFIHGALSDLTLADVFIHLHLHEKSSSKIHDRGTLMLVFYSDQ